MLQIVFHTITLLCHTLLCLISLQDPDPQDQLDDVFFSCLQLSEWTARHVFFSDEIHQHCVTIVQSSSALTS